MNWEQARASALETWTGIRATAGGADPDPVELLSRIHAVNDLCVKARDEAGAPWGHCEYCLFYQQFGGCKEVSGRMSVAIADREWDELTRLLDEFIAHLRQMRLPAPGAPESTPPRA